MRPAAAAAAAGLKPSPPHGTAPRRVGAVSGDITTEAELEALYGLPGGPAVLKEQPVIIDEYRRIIAASPFVVVATVGPEGLDVSVIPTNALIPLGG